MLGPQPHYTPPTKEDRRIFDALVPVGHYLRRAAQLIDFERFRPLMASCYSADWRRPAKEPLLLLKLSFLQYHDRLSDNRLIEAARVNIAYREFLDLGLSSDLPHASLLSYFRARLGAEVFRQIFEALVAQGQRAQAEIVQAADQGATAQERLEAGVTHLRELTDPEGLNLAVFVPLPPPQETAYFTAEDSRVDDSGQTVTCPAGQESAKRAHFPGRCFVTAFGL